VEGLQIGHQRIFRILIMRPEPQYFNDLVLLTAL